MSHTTKEDLNKALEILNSASESADTQIEHAVKHIEDGMAPDIVVAAIAPELGRRLEGLGEAGFKYGVIVAAWSFVKAAEARIELKNTRNKQ